MGKLKIGKAVIALIVITAAQLTFAPAASATVTATNIYSLGYPVALGEDQSGNIYIGDDHNADSSKQGLVVIPSTSGTLFGQSVTAGTAFTLIQRANIRGIAVTPTGDLVYSFSNGNIYALSPTGTTLFGVSVPANTETLIASSTGLAGGLDFDAAGNLYGVYIATGNVYVLPVATGTLYGIAVTANTSTLLYSNGSNWFWDLALDSAGNIFIADGWGLQGVFVLPKNTTTLYGQSVTAGTFVKLTSFGTFRYAGIDVDSNDVLFANIYGSYTRAISATTQTVFQVALTANTVATVTGTSGYVNQGLLVTSSGALITGGGAATYKLVATPTLTAPGAPTIGVAVATSSTTATVAFTAPASNGGRPIETYTATSTPGSIVGSIYQSGSGSIIVTGLSPSTTYTFRVSASNSVGTSTQSSASISITTSGGADELAAQLAAAREEARRAAEAALAKARASLLDLLKSGKQLTLQDVNEADFGEITVKSLNSINKDLVSSLRSFPLTLDEVKKVISTYAMVEKISSGSCRIYTGDLISIGLITTAEPHKSAIIRSIMGQSSDAIDTYAEIQDQVSSVQSFYEVRAKKLAALKARTLRR